MERKQSCSPHGGESAAGRGTRQEARRRRGQRCSFVAGVKRSVVLEAARPSAPEEELAVQMFAVVEFVYFDRRTYNNLFNLIDLIMVLGIYLVLFHIYGNYALSNNH